VLHIIEKEVSVFNITIYVCVYIYIFFKFLCRIQHVTVEEHVFISEKFPQPLRCPCRKQKLRPRLRLVKTVLFWELLKGKKDLTFMSKYSEKAGLCAHARVI
jgi:hypothetical protein